MKSYPEGPARDAPNCCVLAMANLLTLCSNAAAQVKVCLISRVQRDNTYCADPWPIAQHQLLYANTLAVTTPKCCHCAVAGVHLLSALSGYTDRTPPVTVLYTFCSCTQEPPDGLQERLTHCPPVMKMPRGQQDV
jgi:hypothetical protein